MTGRAITGPTLVALAILAPVWWCASPLAQAISAPEQNTIQQLNNRGDLEANANPDESVRPSAAMRSRELDVFSSQDASERANPLWAIPLESLTATRERPIFSPSRRPPLVNATPTAIVVQPDRLTLTLVGAIAGENGIAIFRDDSNKSVVRLRIGQSHSGWSLVRVTQRDATLRKNGEVATVALPTPSAH
jgi:general secretion pathway protein N